MLGANLPYQCDTRESANKLFGHIAGLKWQFVAASYGRTGINTMWNRGAEWRLTGTLGVVIARVPANVETVFDGVKGEYVSADCAYHAKAQYVFRIADKGEAS